MLPPSWKASLTQLLNPEKTPSKNEPPRVAILGIGNEFNGDDAAGVLTARLLASEFTASDHVLVLESGVAPENSTGILRRFKPELVLMVDAAQMGVTPGEIAWIPWETTGGMSASSHSLPLSMLARYLAHEFDCAVHLLGIQPARNEANAPLSPPMQAAVNEIVQTLCEWSRESPDFGDQHL